MVDIMRMLGLPTDRPPFQPGGWRRGMPTPTPTPFADQRASAAMTELAPTGLDTPDWAAMQPISAMQRAILQRILASQSELAPIAPPSPTPIPSGIAPGTPVPTPQPFAIPVGPTMTPGTPIPTPATPVSTPVSTPVPTPIPTMAAMSAPPSAPTMTGDEIAALGGYSNAPIPQYQQPQQQAQQAAQPQQQASGGITINVGGRGDTLDSSHPGRATAGAGSLSGTGGTRWDGQGGLEDALLAENPQLAFLAAFPNYQRNFLLRRAQSEYAGLIPHLSAMASMLGDGSGTVDFTQRFIRGMMGQGGALNIPDMLQRVIGMATGGDADAGGILQGLGNDTLGLLEQNWRQRGVNPLIARTRRNRAAERMQQYELQRLMGGDTATDDTMEWAKLLAELSR